MIRLNQARCSACNVQIAFGENYSLGGKNKTHAHEDLVLRRATFELDGKIVVENGDVVPEEVK